MSGLRIGRREVLEGVAAGEHERAEPVGVRGRRTSWATRPPVSLPTSTTSSRLERREEGVDDRGDARQACGSAPGRSGSGVAAERPGRREAAQTAGPEPGAAAAPTARRPSRSRG